MDTGLLDVGSYFGINHQDGGKMQFRKRAICTVLPFEEYHEIVNLSKDTVADGAFTNQFLGENYIAGLRFLLSKYGRSKGMASFYKNATFGMPLYPSTNIYGR